MNRFALVRRKTRDRTGRGPTTPQVATLEPAPTDGDILTFIGHGQARAAWQARFVAHLRTAFVWVILPFALLFTASVFIHLTDADRRISALCYDQESGFVGFMASVPRAISHWGRFPAVALGVGGLVLSLLGWRQLRLHPWRFSGIYLAAVLLVGPGLVVNSVLKPYFGRPRPGELVEFGGTLQYVPLGHIHEHDRGFSFPSGHAAVGFYLMAPAFLRQRRLSRSAWIAAGLLGGGIVGWSRIVIGCHFFGDILWSAGVVYFTCLAFAPLLRLDTVASARPNTSDAAPLPIGERRAARRDRRRAA